MLNNLNMDLHNKITSNSLKLLEPSEMICNNHLNEEEELELWLNKILKTCKEDQLFNSNLDKSN